MTVYPYLDTRRTRKKGLYSLYIRVISGDKIKLLPTGYKISPSQWAKNTVVRHSDAAIINARVSDMISSINRYAADCILKGQRINLETVGTIKSAYSFTDYITHRAKQYKNNDQPQMETKLKRHVKELSQSIGDLRFDELTPDKLRDHEAYLKAQGNGDNTRNKKFSSLGELYASAVNDGKASLPNPFKSYKIKTKPVKKEKLSVSDINKIEALDLSGAVDLARDIFLFSYYTKGQRFATCITIPRSDITDRVSVRMNKGQKHISVKIHSRLQKIIDKYPTGKFLFDQVKAIPKTKREFISLIGSRNTIINRNLKIVAALAEIKAPISMHIARHSFAFHLKHTASSIGIIQDAMGHSDARITERYLKALGDEVLDKEMEKVYGV